MICAGVAIANIIRKKYQQRGKPSSKKPAAKAQKPQKPSPKKPAVKSEKPTTAFDQFDVNSPTTIMSTLFHYPETAVKEEEKKKSK